MAESEEELKSLLMKMKEESEKAVLKLNIQKLKIMASSPITSWQNRWRNSGWLFFWAPKSLQMMIEAMKLKDAYSLEEKSYDQPRQYIKKQRHYFVNKGLSSQSYGFSSSPVWMWEVDHKESWVPKNLWFQMAMLETCESPLTTRR